MELLIRKPELAELARKIFSGMATEGDFKAANVHDVRAIKCDTGERHFRTLAEPLVRAETDPVRSKRYIASDETVDRMGDVILVKGWELQTFRKNPQALWRHDTIDSFEASLPIGQVTEMEKGEWKGRSALLETITYLEDGISSAADTIWKLVDKGVIRAVSVGFLPIKMTWPESPDEREQLGLGPYGVLFEKQEQIELSNCTIPANPAALGVRAVKSALQDMVRRGEITEAQACAVVDLSEKRRIQVDSVEIPPSDPPVSVAQSAGDPDPLPTTTSGTTSLTVGSGNVQWRFELGADGKLNQVKTETVAAAVEPAPEEALSLEEKVDLLIDLMSGVAGEVATLRTELAETRVSIEAAVGRALPPSAPSPTRLLEAAVARVAQRLAQERI